jgi:hypothetical protein
MPFVRKNPLISRSGQDARACAGMIGINDRMIGERGLRGVCFPMDV